MHHQCVAPLAASTTAYPEPVRWHPPRYKVRLCIDRSFFRVQWPSSRCSVAQLAFSNHSGEQQLFPWPWQINLTFRGQICSSSYSCPRSRLHQIWSFYSFPISSKLYSRDGEMDSRTDGVQHLMRLLREDRIIMRIIAYRRQNANN